MVRPHHDIYSIEDLAQLIFDLHQARPGARASMAPFWALKLYRVLKGLAARDVAVASGGDLRSLL